MKAISEATRRALKIYEQIASHKRRARELEIEFRDCMMEIPPKEIGFLIRSIQAIDEKHNEKLKRFIRRHPTKKLNRKDEAKLIWR